VVTEGSTFAFHSSRRVHCQRRPRFSTSGVVEMRERASPLFTGLFEVGSTPQLALTSAPVSEGRVPS